jgi:hypothetical protein
LQNFGKFCGGVFEKVEKSQKKIDGVGPGTRIFWS